MKSAALVILNVFHLFFFSSLQSTAQPLHTCKDSICHVQIVTDTLYNSPQRINLLILDKESIIFMTVDGRSETAAGMNLSEVQYYMLKLGCLNAINLDGGGSTSMWTLEKGLVNNPSDKTGERPVANALLLLEK